MVFCIRSCEKSSSFSQRLIVYVPKFVILFIRVKIDPKPRSLHNYVYDLAKSSSPVKFFASSAEYVPGRRRSSSSRSASLSWAAIEAPCEIFFSRLFYRLTHLPFVRSSSPQVPRSTTLPLSITRMRSASIMVESCGR